MHENKEFIGIFSRKLGKQGKIFIVPIFRHTCNRADISALQFNLFVFFLLQDILDWLKYM